MARLGKKRERFVWKDEYSVNVHEIDEQHKQILEIINHLMDIISELPKKEEDIKNVIHDLVVYKTNHFATEDKYFHRFNYEGTVEHKIAHKRFDEKMDTLARKYKKDAVGHAFALIDFLEDWFISHIMRTDHKYITFFNEHGLY
jgi:hemerythrin-like metal-binding protein